MLDRKIQKRKSKQYLKYIHTGEIGTGSEVFKPCTARFND
jgi:hypothetical protein